MINEPKRELTVVEKGDTIRAGYIKASEGESVVGRVSENETYFDSPIARNVAKNFKNSTYDLFMTVEWLPSGTQRIEGV